MTPPLPGRTSHRRFGRPPGLAALATLALSATAVAGCGAQGADGTGTAPESRAASAGAPSASISPAPETGRPAQTDTSTTAPNPRPETGTAGTAVPDGDVPDGDVPDGDDTASGREGEPTGATAALLTAAQLPGLTDAFSWTTTGTRGREGKQPFGTCQQFAMTSIGASRVVVREFGPGSGPAGGPDAGQPTAAAAELVARFPDSMTAKRAYQVLLSWHDQCAKSLSRYQQHDVGPVQQVPLDAGAATGFWYLLSYGPAQEAGTAYFDAQGIARAGRRIAALTIRVQAQDHDYPDGAEPMVSAVQRAVQQLR